MFLFPYVCGAMGRFGFAFARAFTAHTSVSTSKEYFTALFAHGILPLLFVHEILRLIVGGRKEGKANVNPLKAAK